MNAHDEHPAAVDRMKQYIEDHLQDTITLCILAQAAGYSPWHAARMFKAHTGKTPFEYIRLRRLSSAARDLSTGSGRVTEVAFDFMFDSHEGFTRAFTRQFGLSPQRFKRVSPPVVMFLPPEMRFYFSSHRKGERSMDPSSKRQSIFVQVIERPARRLILKRGSKATHYFEYCEEVGCEVWEQLGSIEDALNEPMDCGCLPACARPNIGIRARRRGSAGLREANPRGVRQHRASALHADGVSGAALRGRKLWRGHQLPLGRDGFLPAGTLRFRLG